ncbi:MAG: serine O-acetyltransferase [Candidatus Sumerlaeota bacterium]|nr:serine O-acetyltransferase [Candidatus Sumerlaeota bacterium]
MGLFACFSQDLRARGRRVPGPGALLARYLFNPGYRVVVLYRLAEWLRRLPLPMRIGRLFALAILTRLSRVPGVEIRTRQPIGEGVVFPHPHDIVIGGGARIGRNATIYNGVTFGGKGGDIEDESGDLFARYPRIGDDVIVYPGAKIIGPVEIGSRCVIGANSVVLQSFDEDCVIAGVPARLVRRISRES